MSPAADGDDVLGRLTDELTAALLAGEAIDDAQWAARFAVAVADVAACRRALLALERALGEEPACGAPELPRPELPGYTIEAELGRGGMGVVYRAQQQQLGRAVAIKVLRPGDLTFGDALARFRSEAKSLARLRHRHIVSVHDIGETRDGLLWFAMDLIEGETLAAEIRRRGALLPARATKVLRQVTSAIAHAHAQGVVHRDLKPHNVLIDRHGDAFVVDFGLARDAASVSVHTIQGQLLGTPEYMSPEQARGEVARIAEASDVWALGALLYECLGGRGPFAGLPLHATIRAILEDEPRPLRSLDVRVPGPLAAVAGTALQKRPQDRYGSALAFGEELERFAQGDPVLAKPPSRLAAWARRGWRQRRSLAAVVVAVAAVVLWFTHFVLPGLQRESALAAAEQACTEGFPGAAVAPLRAQQAAIARDDPEGPRLGALLLRALVDRTGELLIAGKEAEAQAMAREAYNLASSARHGDAWLDPEYRWQVHRAGSMAESFAWPNRGGDIPPDLEPRIVDTMRLGNPIERHVAQRLAMRAKAGWLNEAGDQVVIPFVLAMHEAAATALANGKNEYLALPDVLRRAQAAPGGVRLSRRAVVTALAGSLAGHPADVDYHRVVLATLFHAFGMPGHYWLDHGGDRRWASPAALLAEANAWAATFTVAATSTPTAAWSALVQQMAGQFLRDGQFGTNPSPGDLQSVLGTWTGQRTRVTPEDQRQWLEANRQRPPADWLRECVEEPDPDHLAPVELLDRACREARPWVAFAWWQLLRLRIPEATDVPLGPPPVGEGVQEWRRVWLRALGASDTRRFSVQIALLHFADGSPEPVLLATNHVEATIGAPFTVATRAHPFVPAIHVQSRRLFSWGGHRVRSSEVLELMPVAAGEVLGGARGIVREDRDGPVLSLDLSDGGAVVIRSQLPGSRVSGHEGSGRPRLRVGHAGSGERNYVSWQGGDRWSDFVLLVRLAERGEPAPLLLGAWRQSFLTHLNDTHQRGFRDTALDHSTASLWSVPEARQALRAWQDHWRSSLGAALLLAGEPSAAADWPRSQYGTAPGLVRLAIGMPDAAQRQRVLSAVGEIGNEWTAGVAATLLRADAAGRVTLPEALRERVQAAAATTSAQPQAVLGLLFVVAMIAGYAVRLIGRRYADVGAFVGLVCSSRLLFADVQVAGVGILPASGALAGMLAGLWLVRLHRGRWWRCVVGATASLMLLSLLWEQGVEVLPVREYALDGWLVVLVVTTLWQSLVSEPLAAFTSRRRAATSPAP